MTYNLTPPLLRRWLAGVLAALIGLGPLATPAYSALIPLADEPLNVKNSAHPNIVLTVDDSTSMLFDFLPDYVVSAYCRGGTGRMEVACGSIGAASDFTAVGGGKYSSPGYIFEQWNFPYAQYTGSYDASGPGAGCYGGSPPTCSPGVNPGSLPGSSTYPAGPQPSWPNSLKPYEYWLLWPAPAHSAGLNALYYDPRLTYDPPVDSTGATYPQMDASNTSSWKSVPADPWASSLVNVDLTTTVTDGLWCNSDWNLNPNDASSPNLSTDRTRCRYNGTNAAAFNSGNGAVAAPEGQDYTYPWAPAGFVASASAGLTTAQTYAAQKVTLTSALNPVDPNYVKYGPLFGEAVTASWANAKNQKYFYENENVIWCDPTSPSWPQTGPTQSQVCGSFQLQACSANVDPCKKDPGVCRGNPVGAACNGLVIGTCNNFGCTGGTAGTCNGFQAGACNFGNCTNKSAQICNGTPQTCAGVAPQTCSGTTAQTCQLPGTQSCAPPVCTTTYNPPGCNLLPPDPENPCSATPTCAPPVCTNNPGTCSITKTSCGGGNLTQGQADAQCPAQPGSCSVSGRTCTTNADCTNVGHCNVDTGTLCSVASDCPIKNGTCSKSPTVACTKNTDCPDSGTCSNAGSKVCLFDTDCGVCSSPAGQACASAAQCTATQGACNQKICFGGANSGKPCTGTGNGTGGFCGTGLCLAVGCSSDANCPLTGGAKCAQGGAACTLSSQCPGKCSTAAGQPWSNKACSGVDQASANAQCRTNGTCAAPSNTSCATSCTNAQWDSNGIDPSCGCQATFGQCQNTKIVPPPACFATACNQGQTQFCCSNISSCGASHAVCSKDADCPNITGICSITAAVCDCVAGGTCNTPGATLASECPSIGKCSITKAQCTSDANCPAQPGPLPPSAAVCTTGGVGGVTTATLRNDAENNGVVCRRNNKASGAYTSSPFTYPSGKFLTPITGPFPPDANATSPDACPVTDHYAATPRHYWKSEVQWCDKAMATAGDKWLGYGTDAGGTCQAGKDATHIYPRFFQFGAASYVDNYSTSAFQRVDLVPLDKNGNASTFTHTWIDATGQTQTITRNFAQEMTNYANWFAYYRTRIQAVKTVTSLSFTALDDQYRVGFHTLSNGETTSASQSDPAVFVNIADFDATQKAAWWAQLFGIKIPLGLETPTLNAMERIGEYFLNGAATGLTGATDPIILSCQKNWHMLFTDGFTNQSKLPTTTVANQDDTVPALPDPVTGLTAGSPWPHPFREDPTAGAPNAASDYAMNYWVTDLRTSGAFSNDNVPGTTKDPATWQHLNFAAMSLGTQGKLPVANQSLTENLLSAGTLQWPQPYPTVYKPDNSGVDDLWHAAINGRGRFVNAGSAAELKLGMGQILQDITNQAGSRAGVGLASSSISLANHAVYRVTFQPGWAGTVTKIDIDVVTGAEVANLWEAAQQLHNQLTIVTPDPTCTASGSCPWFTGRKIFTTDDSNTAVPFLWGNLSSAQQDSLAPGLPAVGQAVLEYLRGNPTNEGVGLGQFRVRATASFGENFLGDIVDSQAVYVGPPTAPYLDSNDPGYSSFVTAQASRPARVYAGGNDGMLHAFTDANGDEAWAYIPHDLYRPDSTGLGALAYQDGALPPFRHHFYVDSTPRIVDIDLGGANWRSVLVGGLGKGGKSYYAIDVTKPAAVTTEAQAAAQYLWTFTDADMGYSYGKPMLAKTRAFSGKWLMVVAAGYNNPTGVGKVFFVDAASGKKEDACTMSTGFGNSTSPSGLAHISGYTQDFRNQLIDQVYGGDLYGNFWRFDVRDPDCTKWSVQLMAQLTDPGGVAQPVTTPPQIEVDLANSVDRWVFIGTGRLLDDTDLTDTTIANQQQTFYAIRDGTTTTPNPITAALTRTDLVSLASVTNGEVLGLTTKPAKGWYHDLPLGERIITPVQAAVSVVAYAGTSAQDNPCLTGEPATLYVREFSLGESLLTDAGGNPISGIGEVQGAVGLDIAIFTDSSGAQSASGVDIRVAVTAGTTGDVIFQHIKPPSFLAAHRMTWRLLGQ